MMALHSPAASAAELVDAEVVAAIIADARARSEAAELFYTLTDELGPRLSGSPAYDRAAEWAVERFAAWGLANARLEPFEFGRASGDARHLSGFPREPGPALPALGKGA
jgi:hypothetical protein